MHNFWVDMAVAMSNGLSDIINKDLSNIMRRKRLYNNNKMRKTITKSFFIHKLINSVMFTVTPLYDWFTECKYSTMSCTSFKIRAKFPILLVHKHIDLENTQ